MSKWFALPASAVLLAGCTLNLAKSGDDGRGNQVLNDSIQWPSNAYALEAPETDETITIMPPAGGGTTTPAVMGGGSMNVSVPFSAPGSNVVGVGIRFGDSGKIMTIPTSTMGQRSGTLSTSVPIPPEICGMLSRICHDIKCYEFAVTSVGKVSRANIMSLALMCGNCTEPSCKSLLPDMCPAGPGPIGQCSDQTSCSTEGSSAKIRFCTVVNGSCGTGYYETSSGQRFNCTGTCTQPDCTAAVQAAVNYCTN